MINLKASEQPSPPPQDGIEILLQMAKTGQLDPWNVNIVEVADKYLRAVAELRESDLKVTGKMVLYLAILLRMKSDQLAGINYLDPPQEDEFFDELMDPDLMEDVAPQKATRTYTYRSLDEVLKRRTSTKQPRIRQVTLNDLILELRKYEELEKKRSLREKLEKVDQRRVADYSRFTADDIEELAHEEFLEDTIFHLKDILERLFLNQERVSLSELEEKGGLDKISAFLALLFLTARGEVDMEQDEFYGELYVCPDTSSHPHANAGEDTDSPPHSSPKDVKMEVSE